MADLGGMVGQPGTVALRVLRGRAEVEATEEREL